MSTAAPVAKPRRRQRRRGCEQEIRPGEMRVRPGPGADARQQGEAVLPQRA